MNTIDANDLLAKMKALANQAQQTQMTEAPQEVQSFQKVLGQAINNVNELSQNAGDLVKRFEQNDPNVTINQVMVASQKSSLSFQAMIQVRNHLVNAYQDIMNMPI